MLTALLFDLDGARRGEVGRVGRRFGVGAGREKKAEKRDQTAGAGDGAAEL